MTKDQEIDLLEKITIKLGPASYMGPWLFENLPKIKWAIRNDLEIDIALNFNPPK